jgi:hypothetical protein
MWSEIKDRTWFLDLINWAFGGVALLIEMRREYGEIE